MSFAHFFAASVDGDVVSLRDEEARHARTALRIQSGETIGVSDGRGMVVNARVRSVGEIVEAEVIERRFVPRARPIVIAFPAVSKSGKLDLVVEKLTELGVDEIRPWFAARSVVRWDESKRAAHGDRWRAIARAASKQSRRAWLPDVANPATSGGFPPKTIVLHEDTSERLRDVLPDDPGTIGVVVGPEGGLEPEEVARMCGDGARAAGLGDQILRTETATIAAIALVLSRYGRLG